MTHSDFNQFLSNMKRLTAGQAQQIRQQLDREYPQPKKRALEPAAKNAKRTKTAQPSKKPLTEAELQQHMLEIGLMSQLPDTDADYDDPADQPITIKGEPVSETIIRERR